MRITYSFSAIGTRSSPWLLETAAVSAATLSR
ncbi:Uncharacterised protein [Vibrio cholerae]|nr:Uncharacterised protein [Vibrio cholerae]